MGLISTKLLKPRPQELGRIKIGGLGEERTAQSGRKYQLPVKYDCFVIATRHRGKDGNFERDDRIHAKVGDRPTELHGVLMYPTPEENFHAEMVQYEGRTKVVSCTGEERTDLRSGDCTACPRLNKPDFDCGCKPYMRLHIQLWDSPLLGYHVFRSTGWETTNNIQSALNEIYERFGTLYRAPVRLVVYPATVNYEENGKSKTSNAYMVGLVLNASMEEVAQQMVQARRLMDATRQELKMLSGQVLTEQAERDVEEAEEIAQEFFPQAGIQSSVASQEKLDGLKSEMAAESDGDDPVVDAEYTIEESNGQAEAGPSVTRGGRVGDGNDAEGDPPPAEADRTALETQLTELMLEKASRLWNDRDARRKWLHRHVQRTALKRCTDEELRLLIERIEAGDISPEGPEGATARATPFDDDEGDGEQGAMPA